MTFVPNALHAQYILYIWLKYYVLPTQVVLKYVNLQVLLLIKELTF